jgi:hypothetical protein
MINPHQTPTFDPKHFQDQPPLTEAAVSDYGWVSQVRTFAILNAVQGVLEISMGLFTSGMGIALPALLRWDKAKNPTAGGPEQETFLWFLTGLYLVIGIPVLVSGVLRIESAWQNYRFKGRLRSLISLVVGMGAMLSCYCAPTAIALLVYGLILHLNPAVKAAFEMGRQGRTAAQILAAFNPYPSASYAAPTPAASPGQPPLGENPFGSA